VNGWQFVIHQDALETIDALPSSDRREIRKALYALVNDPYHTPTRRFGHLAIVFTL
jgi:hypothetical protein